MNQRKMDPAYLKIFSAPPEKFRLVGQVKVLDVFQSNTRDFHDEGLFSQSIFGRVGSDDRLRRMGYIDIYVPIFHPRIFNHLCSLKQLYKGIMSGREFAIWDKTEKDFVKADQLTGETGYAFFLKHWEDINFKRTKSTQRDEKIAIVKKFKNEALTSRILVLPAGLRDLEVDENGGIDQHEMNDFYRGLIKISNTLSTVNDLDSPIIDKARFALQLQFNELHDYILTNATKGKGSYMSAKFGRRKLKYGTRNVFAAVSPAVKHLDDPNNLTPLNTQIGLYQAIKATEPMMIYHLNTGYLNRVFNSENSAWLIDPKTLNRVEVKVKPRIIDKWTTPAGLSKLIDGFENPKLRNKDIMLEGHYLGLVYKRDGCYKLVYSMDEIRPDHMDDKDYISPITYGELFFILCNRYIKKLPADITRYPIEGTGSVYPSYNYLVTTTQPLTMTELDDSWNKTEYFTSQYPNVNSNNWFDIMGPYPIQLTGMGADFDGDTGNNNVNMSIESMQATAEYLDSILSHIDVNNRMLGSPLTDIPVRVIYNLTGD